MSTKYRSSKEVPTETLIQRLKELSDAVAGGSKTQEREYTMRIPAECDRDADIVIDEAARRLHQAEARVAELNSCLNHAFHIASAKPQDYAIMMALDNKASFAWLLRKQAESVMDARREFIGRGYAEVQSVLIKFAQRLYQQADELERDQ